MFLVIDVGNTNTVMGIYEGSRLLRSWRIRTEKNTTEDEFNVLTAGLFAQGGILPKKIGKTIVSCVVPPMVNIIEAFCKKYLGHAPLWVGSTTKTGMPILYRNPDDVGADRIVNAVAGYTKYKTSLIIIDFGTATTFDAVSPQGEYLGGAICPGIMISAEALFQTASKLPRVELFIPPENVIGKNTTGSIQSGIIFGYAGLVDGIVRRMKKEMGTDPKVLATGGLAPLLEKVSETIEAIEPDMTLEGLRIIGERVEADTWNS